MSTAVLVGLAAVLGLVLLAVLPFLMFTPRAPRIPAGATGVAALDAYFRALTDHETPPALDIIVVKDGQVAYRRSFGMADRISQRPAAADAIYHFWSVTKLFTATASFSQVTKEDVQRVVKTYFTDKNRTVATLIPESAEPAKPNGR